ncbi:MAG: 50S ribosomal protein L25/general stress protein Ctc [Flavobacteriales bacterium]|nr:50S ribosomal protein L25/general stress protein Ctc [Flavobacteriales bacterium]MDG1766756.1 50S ribosomal protein L25/general stress protein Ctc [Flavobacteriales bacterium]
MKTASLSGSLRENVGKKDADTLRKNGRVPGVLYGGEEQIHFHVDNIALEKLVYTPDAYRFDFEVNGKTYPTIIKDMQFHPVNDKIQHMDMLQLFDDKPVTVELPVRTSGNSIGVRNGGRLAISYRSLKVRGLPNDLPEAIVADITNLKIGDAARVKDLSIEGCEILAAENAVVVDVKRTRAAMAAAAAAAEAEKGKK